MKVVSYGVFYLPSFFIFHLPVCESLSGSLCLCIVTPGLCMDRVWILKCVCVNVGVFLLWPIFGKSMRCQSVPVLSWLAAGLVEQLQRTSVCVLPGSVLPGQGTGGCVSQPVLWAAGDHVEVWDLGEGLPKGSQGLASVPDDVFANLGHSDAAEKRGAFVPCVFWGSFLVTALGRVCYLTMVIVAEFLTALSGQRLFYLRQTDEQATVCRG